VSSSVYYLLWLAAGLLFAAGASAAISHHLRWRIARRAKAAEALDAMARYCQWVAAQRRAMFFAGDCNDPDAPLRELQAIRREWFPELAAEGEEVLSQHARLIDHLWSQQLMRARDPEDWLESDHDAAFVALWREHVAACDAFAGKLRRAEAPPPSIAYPMPVAER
jgi:hypothetical protein